MYRYANKVWRATTRSFPKKPPRSKINRQQFDQFYNAIGVAFFF